MTASDLPALRTSPEFIFFTDFDGTITLKDSNDYLTDNIGYGQARRVQENKDVLNGKNTFRKSFAGMMESVTLPYNKCIQLLVENIKLDPHFKDFFDWSLENNIPVVVLSGGMVPIITAILKNLVGPESDKIQIVSNDVKTKNGKTFDDEDGWELVFHDDSDFGHDKSLTLRPYAQLPPGRRPTLFFAGDGVSDLSAARECDLLFAKSGKDLGTYCARENIPFTTFEDWSSIKSTVQDIASGKQTVEDAASEGYQRFKTGHSHSNGFAK